MKNHQSDSHYSWVIHFSRTKKIADEVYFLHTEFEIHTFLGSKTQVLSLITNCFSTFESKICYDIADKIWQT